MSFSCLGSMKRFMHPLPLDSPFTHHEPTLRVALAQAIKARRSDRHLQRALTAGLRLCEQGRFERQVLLVVSDGGDNASAVTRAQVLANAQASNAVIYTIALVDPMDSEADPGFLSQLSEMTGGVAFRPKNGGEVDEILQRVARDIRNMYTLGYVPSGTTRQPPRGVGKRRPPPCRGRRAAAERSEGCGAHETRVLAGAEEVQSDAR